MERVFELVSGLTSLPSVSGYEEAAFEGLSEICKGMFDETFTNPAGSFVGVVRCKKEKAKTLVLDAHRRNRRIFPVDDDGFFRW